MTIIVGIICFVVGVLIGYLLFPIYAFMFIKVKNRDMNMSIRNQCEIELYDEAEIEED